MSQVSFIGIGFFALGSALAAQVVCEDLRCRRISQVFGVPGGGRRVHRLCDRHRWILALSCGARVSACG